MPDDDSEKLVVNLQESVLTALCFDNAHGAGIASLVEPNLFDEPYRRIARAVLDYRSRYSAAPGVAHIDDIFETLIDKKRQTGAPVLARILTALREQAEGLNAEYVLTRVSEFAKRQHFKRAAFEVVKQYQGGAENIGEDVERIFLDAVRHQATAHDPGTFLNDKGRALSFLTRDHQDRLTVGIPEFDKRGLGPGRKELWLFMAPRKRGKSWAMVHLGRQALIHRWKVCHVSLEMSEEQVAQRYFQSLFAIAKRPDASRQTIMEYDELGRLAGLRLELNKPKLHWQLPNITKLVSKKVDEWGAKLGRIVIKKFPTGKLTVPQLEAYLDYLENVNRFVPDLLIVDYPDLMKLSASELRQDLTRTYVDLRGLADVRNIAVAVPTQANRAGTDAKLLTSVHVADAIDKIATADIVITYNQTKQEKELGLARLFVDAARTDEDKFSVIVSQNYASGQFVLSSASMQSRYFDQLDETLGAANISTRDEDS